MLGQGCSNGSDEKMILWGGSADLKDSLNHEPHLKHIKPVQAPYSLIIYSFFSLITLIFAKNLE